MDIRAEARDEYNDLDYSVAKYVSKHLDKIAQNPMVPANRMRGEPGWFRAKLRKHGIRIVYRVKDKELLILVVAIGKREDNEVYEIAKSRE